MHVWGDCGDERPCAGASGVSEATLARCCNTCGQVKPAEEFPLAPGSDVNRRKDCQGCIRLKSAAKKEAKSAAPKEKRCTRCGGVKPLADFGQHKIWRSASEDMCRACDAEGYELVEAANREHQRKVESELEDARWWAKNSEKVAQWQREYSFEGFVERLRAAGNNREAALLLATPTWANHKKIAAIYEESARRTRETGIQYHVDHIVPLQGPIATFGPFRGMRIVYGLHWEGNLEVISGSENMSKGNRRWPHMPEVERIIDKMLCENS